MLLLLLLLMCGSAAVGYVHQQQRILSPPRLATRLCSTERGRGLAEEMKGANIYFIGPMGSGKSVVGDLVCRNLGSYSFVDTDTMIESLTGNSISVVDDEFRATESRVLNQVAAFVRLVVATGGGIVLKQSNWAALRTGVVVFLNPTDEILVERLEEDQTDNNNNRPLLQNNASKIIDIFEERRSLYQQADVTVTVDNSKESPQETADRVVDTVLQFIKENPPKRPPPPP